MVESTALEMRHTGNRIGGSNPSLSATLRPNVERPIYPTPRFRLRQSEQRKQRAREASATGRPDDFFLDPLAVGAIVPKRASNGSPGR